MNPEIPEQLRKIAALVDSPVEGEQQNARDMLAKLCEKYGLDPADLTEPDRVDHWFKYRTANERQLLVQIVGNVRGWDLPLYQCKETKEIVCECTKAEAAEIQVLFKLYRKDLRDHMETAFVAFVHANDLTRPADPDEQTELDPEEMARLMAMIAGTERTKVPRALIETNPKN